jgi:hypothetical protein
VVFSLLTFFAASVLILGAILDCTLAEGRVKGPPNGAHRGYGRVEEVRSSTAAGAVSDFTKRPGGACAASPRWRGQKFQHTYTGTGGLESYMEQENGVTVWENHSSKIWLGIALGTAIGLGVAISRRPKKSRWDIARRATQQISGRSAEFADAARDIVDRVKVIYEEGARIAQDAGELWTRGRKLVGY